MPTLMTLGRRSETTARICASTTSGSTHTTPLTPQVFCTVRAVMTDAAYTPRAESVLRSA